MALVLEGCLFTRRCSLLLLSVVFIGVIVSLFAEFVHFDAISDSVHFGWLLLHALVY